MAFGLETYTSLGVKQVDAANFNYCRKRYASNYNGDGSGNHMFSQSYAASANAWFVTYGDPFGPTDGSGLDTGIGEIIAVGFPPAGRSISQSGLPVGMGVFGFPPAYVPFYVSGSVKPSINSHIFAKPTDATGLGLAVYNDAGQLIFASNEASLRIVGILNANYENINTFITVDSSRSYCALFLSPIGFYKTATNTFRLMGVERNSDKVYVRQVATFNQSGLNDPILANATNLVAIADVTNF